MLVEEALRLYPPTWVTARMTTDNLDFGGYRIPADAILLLSPFVTQRDPRFWEDPERFDPGRFAPERSIGRPRYAYFPFGAGPRACIGSAFALMEMQVVLAMVAQRYELTLVPGWRVEPDPGILLQPRHGVMMRVRLRTGSRPSR
jgi:cytochrome P450